MAKGKKGDFWDIFRNPSKFMTVLLSVIYPKFSAWLEKNGYDKFANSKIGQLIREWYAKAPFIFDAVLGFASYVFEEWEPGGAFGKFIDKLAEDMPSELERRILGKQVGQSSSQTPVSAPPLTKWGGYNQEEKLAILLSALTTKGGQAQSELIQLLKDEKITKENKQFIIDCLCSLRQPQQVANFLSGFVPKGAKMTSDKWNEVAEALRTLVPEEDVFEKEFANTWLMAWYEQAKDNPFNEDHLEKYWSDIKTWFQKAWHYFDSTWGNVQNYFEQKQIEPEETELAKKLRLKAEEIRIRRQTRMEAAK